MLNPPRKLILVGAGGFAHEVLYLCSVIPEDARQWKIAGFLDDNPDRARESLRRRMVDLPVFGTTSDYSPREDDCFALAMGSPRSKRDTSIRLAERGAQFVNLLHPAVTVMQRTVIGTGCIFMARVTVGPYVRVGDFVTINLNSGVGHDAVLEDYVTLSAFCDVTGNAVLRRGVLMGSHAVVLPGCEVGEFAVVGAGSVAIRKTRPGASIFGVPAKEFI